MTIGGGLRPFHVGTNQTAIFCELRGEGYDLQDYNDLLVSIVGNTARANEASKTGEAYIAQGRKEMTPAEHRDFIFSALVAGAQRERQPVDFTKEDVGDWLDEADAIEAAKPLLMQIQLMADRMTRQGNAPAPQLTASRGGAAKPKKKSR